MFHCCDMSEYSEQHSHLLPKSRKPASNIKILIAIQKLNNYDNNINNVTEANNDYNNKHGVYLTAAS